ncbi:MAG: PH domain-containing protein [Chloroflexi bacterium]|nr:PH domain-containing protein [Chloroflexota bacterium]
METKKRRSVVSKFLGTDAPTLEETERILRKDWAESADRFLRMTNNPGMLFLTSRRVIFARFWHSLRFGTKRRIEIPLDDIQTVRGGTPASPRWLGRTWLDITTKDGASYRFRMRRAAEWLTEFQRLSEVADSM